MKLLTSLTLLGLVLISTPSHAKKSIKTQRNFIETSQSAGKNKLKKRKKRIMGLLLGTVISVLTVTGFYYAKGSSEENNNENGEEEIETTENEVYTNKFSNKITCLTCEAEKNNNDESKENNIGDSWAKSLAACRHNLLNNNLDDIKYYLSKPDNEHPETIINKGTKNLMDSIIYHY